MYVYEKTTEEVTQVNLIQSNLIDLYMLTRFIDNSGFVPSLREDAISNSKFIQISYYGVSGRSRENKIKRTWWAFNSKFNYNA